MKHFSRFLLCLAIGTGMIAGCDPDIVLVGSHEDLLTVSPSQQKISADGTASFTFTFKLLKPSKNNVKELVDLKETETIATIHFEATGGTVNPASATTDENGNVTVTFTASDLENFTGGTVKGIVKRVTGKVADQQGDLATATATVLPLNGGDEPSDDGLKKANALNDNTYVYDNESYTIGTCEDDYLVYYHKTDPDSDKSVVVIEFCREHPVNNSVAGGMVHVTPEMLGKEIDMLANENGMAFINFWTLKDPNQGYNSETNPETNMNTSTADKKAQLEKATCKVTKNADGVGYTALAYFKTKDGKEAYYKMKATVEPNWQ